MVFIDQRESGRRIGSKYEKLILAIKQRMYDTDDDCTAVFFGPTGSGKSTIMLHTNKIWLKGEKIDVRSWGFDEQSWALALEYADSAQGVDFVAYDEGNKSRRRSMSQENVEFIDLLFNIRYKNWFKALANPSADYLDKALIDEGIVNLWICVYAKQKRFFVFTQAGINRLLEKHGNLKINTIKKYGREFALLDSYFYAYTGDEWDEYDKRKELLTQRKLDSYIEKRKNGQLLTASDVANKLGIHITTVTRHLNALIADGLLRKEDIKTPTNIWKINDNHVQLLINRMRNVQNERNIKDTREEKNANRTKRTQRKTSTKTTKATRKRKTSRESSQVKEEYVV